MYVSTAGITWNTWASYQIRKIAGCACAGNAGNVFPQRRLQRKPLVSDPGMHHGTCVTHVPWCVSGSLNRGVWEHVPGIPGACAPAILRIALVDDWQQLKIDSANQGLLFICCFRGRRVQHGLPKWYEPLLVQDFGYRLICAYDGVLIGNWTHEMNTWIIKTIESF